MASYTLSLVQGTRSWTGQELAALSFQLGSSGQVWMKSDSCVIRRLDDKGRLLISQVDHWYPGQRLHELYDVDHDETMEFGLRYSLKNQSVFVTLSQALQDQGFNGLVPVTSLDQVHMLTYLQVLPSGTGKWLAVDNSETHITQLVKRSVQKTYKQLFESHDHLTLISRVVNRILRSTHITENQETHMHQTRNHNTYEAGVAIVDGSSNYPANTLELAGMYAENLGNQRIRIGPTGLRPVITVSQSSPYTVEAQAGQTLTVPSATATDPLTGSSLSVTASPATVSLGSLATHTITYSCATSAGDLSSSLLQLVVQDSTSPVLVVLGLTTVTVSIGDTYGSAEDAGATASDNLLGDITSSIVTTGLPVNTSAATTATVTYSVSDGIQSASIVRSVVVASTGFTVYSSTGTNLIGSALSTTFPSSYTSYVGFRISMTWNYVGSSGTLLGGSGSGWVSSSPGTFNFSYWSGVFHINANAGTSWLGPAGLTSATSVSLSQASHNIVFEVTTGSALSVTLEVDGTTYSPTLGGYWSQANALALLQNFENAWSTNGILAAGWAPWDSSPYNVWSSGSYSHLPSTSTLSNLEILLLL
jgi:hypothetical protein